MSKPKVAIISLTSCEGCQFAILDAGQKFFTFREYFDFVDFRLVQEYQEKIKLDIAVVEGSTISDEQVKLLKKIRKQSRILVVLGNCAAMGGIQEIKNYHNAQDIIRKVYKNTQGLNNQKVQSVPGVVKVDYFIPTCPINVAEFIQLLTDFLKDKKFKIPERPVCYECQVNQYKCLLQKKRLCFGPWIKGGCRAICLKNGQPCWGCRGLLKEADRQKMFSVLEKIANRAEILKQAEVFGLRDDLEK